MVGRTIDERLQKVGHSVVCIMNGNSPEINKHEEHKIDHFVQWEDEGVNVVGKALEKSINRMERVACERSWHLPPVMWLMYVHV